MFDLSLSDIYSKIFSSSVVGIGITDIEGNYIIVNPAWTEFMGYTADEAKSLNVRDLTVASERDGSDRSLQMLLNQEVASINKVRRYLRKDGTEFWADLFVSALVDDGEVVGIIGMLINIDRQVRAENRLLELNRQLKIMARHDPLTGLNNRRSMEEALNRDFRRVKRYKHGFVVAIADVDDFKNVNDTYGHECGDMVLRKIAKTFVDLIRDTDTVGRWGGEEFIFAFSDTTDQGAKTAAERIREKLSGMVFKCKGREFKITITIGLSIYMGQDTVGQIINEADQALYWGKDEGKNQVHCFQEKYD